MEAIKSSLFSQKTGRHCAFGLRPTKYSVLKNPVWSVPSSGRPVWLVQSVASGKEHSKILARFITDDTAKGEIDGDGKTGSANADRNQSLMDSPSDGLAISHYKECHHRVGP